RERGAYPSATAHRFSCSFLLPGRITPAAMARTTPFGLAVKLFAIFAVAMPALAAAQQAPAPAPTSDGTSIDQGIAYLLMIVALVLTYLIHPLDASSPYKLF
ncbi:unnamed protein product, partial [Urochloa humidicola]